MRGIPEKKKTELHTPLWLSALQLVFAALLLYIIRNPAPIYQLEMSLHQDDKPARMIVNLPMGNVAVAATQQELTAKQPM